MTEVGYKYSVLKYKHSAVLGEHLNIGLLIYFNSTNSFVFIYSRKLTRVKSVYSNVSEKLIKFYLNQIGKKAEKFKNISDEFLRNEIRSSFDNFINRNLLPKDSSALQFSRSRSGFQYKKENIEIVDHLKKVYLFEEAESKNNKDYALAKKFYEKIKKEIGFDYDPNNFQKDYKVKNSTGVEFKFNYAWQNGSLNLVKPLNFDLQDPKFISEKAHRNFGLIVDLGDKAKKENLRFDFLVGKPTDKRLYREYDHSISLLSKLDKLRIIEEEDLTEYSWQAINSIKGY